MFFTRKPHPPVVPEPTPDHVAEVASAHRNAYLLAGLGGAVLVAFGLAGISSIVAPVFLALVLTICVYPLRTWLERHGTPRGIATGSVIIAVLALIVVFGYAIIIAFGQFAQLLPQFAPQIQGWLASVATWLGTIGFGPEQVQNVFNGFDPSKLVGFVGGVVGGVAGWTSTFVVIFTTLLLMAMDAAFFPTLLRQLKPRRPLIVSSLVAYGKNVRRYMVVTTGLGVTQGVINWVVLLILGVPGAFIWGLLSFICSFIPNVGYFIAIIPPILFGALIGGWPTVIAVIILYGVVNAGVQSIVQPRVVGNAVALSQTITFFSVLFWAVILGPTGAILAIPLTLLVRMLLVDMHPTMHWIMPLLGDLEQTKELMSDADASTKAARKQRRAAKRTA